MFLCKMTTHTFSVLYLSKMRRLVILHLYLYCQIRYTPNSIKKKYVYLCFHSIIISWLLENAVAPLQQH